MSTDLMTRLLSIDPSSWGPIDTLRNAQECMPDLATELATALTDGSLELPPSMEPLGPVRPDQSSVEWVVPCGVVAVLTWLADEPLTDATVALFRRHLDSPWADVRSAAAQGLAGEPALALAEIESRAESDDRRVLDSAFMLASWMVAKGTIGDDGPRLHAKLAPRVSDLVGQAKSFATKTLETLAPGAPKASRGTRPAKANSAMPVFAGLTEAAMTKLVEDLAWIPAGEVDRELRVLEASKVGSAKTGELRWFLLEHDLYRPRSLDWFALDAWEPRHATILARELTRLPVSGQGYAGLSGWSAALDDVTFAAYRLSPAPFLECRSQLRPTTRLALDFVRSRCGEEIDEETTAAIVTALARHSSFDVGDIKTVRDGEVVELDAATLAQSCYCSEDEWAEALERASEWGNRE